MKGYATLEVALKAILKSRINDLKFFGTKAIFSMKNPRKMAEISIEKSGTYGKYTKLAVKIQSTMAGEICQNEFVFEDYLEKLPNDNQRGKDEKLHIWADSQVGIDWFIHRPKSTEPIANAVFEYIEMYTDE